MEKVTITSITASNFVQAPKRPTADNMELCSYCEHAHQNLPPCCHTCRKTVTCSDGKIFHEIVEADLHCRKSNRRSTDACI